MFVMRRLIGLMVAAMIVLLGTAGAEAGDAPAKKGKAKPDARKKVVPKKKDKASKKQTARNRTDDKKRGKDRKVLLTGAERKELLSKLQESFSKGELKLDSQQSGRPLTGAQKSGKSLTALYERWRIGMLEPQAEPAPAGSSKPQGKPQRGKGGKLKSKIMPDEGGATPEPKD